MNNAKLRAIMKEDNARRAARRLLEDATLGISMIEDCCSDAYKIAHNNVTGARVNPCLVRGIGTVNPPAPTSASRNSWDRGMRGRVVGIAPGTEKTATESTVLVIKPGQPDEVVAVSSLRGKTSKRATTDKKSVRQSQPETARITLRGMDWDN